MVNDIINPFMPYEFTPAIIEHVDLKKYNPLNGDIKLLLDDTTLYFGIE